MRLLDLPNEILYLVADNLPNPSDLSRFTRTNQFVHALLTDYLYRNAARDIPPNHDFSPALISSVNRGLESAVARFLKWTSKVPNGEMLLSAAVLQNQDLGVTKLLLDHWGMASVTHGSKGLFLNTLIFKEKIEMLRLLLDLGCNVNRPDSLGFSPLARAVKCRRPEIVTLFLDYGADINDAGFARAPLHQAVFVINKPDMVEMLVRRGADVNVACPNGDTALHLVASNKFNPSWTSYLVEFLAENGADLQIRNNAGKTALDIAVERGNKSCQASLLDALQKSGQASSSGYQLSEGQRQQDGQLEGSDEKHRWTISDLSAFLNVTV